MISFREVTVEDARMILDWRTQERVARGMITNVAYDIEQQRAWIERSFRRKDYYHWIVQHAGRDIGFFNFSGYDPVAKDTSWGFYVGVNDAKGLGRLIPPHFHVFAFDELGVESIRSEVLYTNPKTVQLYLSYGYQFEPKRDEVVIKDDQEMLVIALRLEKAVFLRNRPSQKTADFPVTQWDHKDQIAPYE